MKLRSLNQQGFSHIILPMLVVGVVSLVGVRILTASHADTTASSSDSGFTSVAAAVLYSRACYNGTNTVQVKPPEVPAVATASSFFNQVTDLSSGASAANATTTSATQLLYASPNDVIADNIYHATAGETYAQMLDNSNVISGQSFNTSSLKPCANKTIVPAYVGNGYIVSPIVVSTTISRASALACGAAELCSRTDGVTIADTTSSAGGFSFSVASQTQGFLNNTSGGIQPNGSLLSQLAISPNLANGTYTGSSVLSLNSLTGKSEGYVTGPTIDYSITLTN